MPTIPTDYTISPHMSYEDRACLIPPNDMVSHTTMHVDRSSYGINLRRSRILSTVRCLLYRMVVSAITITVTMSRIPTDYSKFTPNSRADYMSYILLPNGSSDDYVYQVYSSYGIT